MTEHGLQTWEEQRAKLGGREPFAYVFTEEEEHILKTFMHYQFESGLLLGQIAGRGLFADGVHAF